MAMGPSPVREMKGGNLRGLAQELAEKPRKSATIDWQSATVPVPASVPLVKVLLKAIATCWMPRPSSWSAYGCGLKIARIVGWATRHELLNQVWLGRNCIYTQIRDNAK